MFLGFFHLILVMINVWGITMALSIPSVGLVILNAVILVFNLVMAIMHYVSDID